MNPSRRDVLIAASTSPLLLPFFNRELSAADDIRPPRFLFVVKSSGLTPAELVPNELRSTMVTNGEEAGWPDELRPSDSLLDLSLVDKKLPVSLRALAPFKDKLTIGRTGDNDIQLDAPYISRRHAVVTTDGETTRVIDWGSKNGVFVNSKRVSEHFLANGDIVTIGNAHFRYDERPKRDV